MVISMADGSHARHYDDNPLSKLLLSHRDSSTAEVVAKAMEDSLNDGVYRSGNDLSYARPLVTELPSTSSSDGIRVLQPVNTIDLSSATMADGVPMTDERFEDIHSLVLQKCATHPFHICPTCPVCKSFEDESRRIAATRQELIKQPCDVHRYKVDSTCRECLLWSAQGGDLRAEKKIDFSVAEPANRDLCSFINEQVAFGRIRKTHHRV